jgi:hypothetical protein
LRTLLIVVGISGLTAAAWREISDALPYREQRQTMALIEQLGGSYETAEASEWHRRLFGSDLQNLVLVNLADCDVPDRYIEALAALPQLETLAVGGEAFADGHLDQLRHTATLRYLVLDSTAVSDEAVTALRAAQPNVEVYFSERRALAELTGIGMKHERSAQVPQPLRERVGDAYFHTCWLLCCVSRVSDADLAHVRHLRNLEILRVYESSVSDAGLANLQGLVQLRELNLAGTKITDAGVAHLARLINLRELHLDRAPISDAGLAHLKDLGQLEQLELDSTPIGDAGLVHLKGLAKLEDLGLGGTRCTRSGARELQKVLPQCRIFLDRNAAE